MKTHGLVLFLSVVTVAVAGCNTQKQASLRNQRDINNKYAMDDAPALVQAGFRRDYPGVQPSSMTHVETRTQGQMYKILFILDGKPYDAVYDRDGNLVTPALLPQAAYDPERLRQMQPQPQPAGADLKPGP